MDLWKYGQTSTIQRSLTIKWLRFSKKRFMIWIYHFIFHHILSPSNKFGMWFNIYIYFPFYDVLNKWWVRIFRLQKSFITSKWVFLSINNHIVLFTMKLLV
jgi:hypothetical protein